LQAGVRNFLDRYAEEYPVYDDELPEPEEPRANVSHYEEQPRGGIMVPFSKGVGNKKKVRQPNIEPLNPESHDESEGQERRVGLFLEDAGFYKNTNQFTKMPRDRGRNILNTTNLERRQGFYPDDEDIVLDAQPYQGERDSDDDDGELFTREDTDDRAEHDPVAQKFHIWGGSEDSRKEGEAGEREEINPVYTKSHIWGVPTVQQSPASAKDAAAPSAIINYPYPPVALLNPAQAGLAESGTEIRDNSRKLEETLRSFRVEARVAGHSIGPTVTRYEVEPGPGVKVSSIANLSNDLALALAAQSIRIEAPVPGTHVVGVEIPNKKPRPVLLREILEDAAFTKHDSTLAVGIGKDITGSPVVTDIVRMPHLLIAGATGAGKSVCINTLIISILYRAHPDLVRLLLIDPKVVELSVYNEIPHLLIPVVTDPKQASNALSEMVKEMEKRYRLFATYKVRDIAAYNAFASDGAQQLTLDGEEPPQPMPLIVIIIDELADLMMACKGQVEESICRLAQKARAAGLHLIVATQRPSVDVITGLIKANIPSRLAFAVSSGVDSRTVLDMVGAEKLLGKGDMLFLPIGRNKPLRIQGCFVSDEEVRAVVAHIVEHTEYEIKHDNELSEKIQRDEPESASEANAGTEKTDDGTDEFFAEAAEFLLDKGKASTSMLQRQFRIGYNRASRLMEDLEARGVVGPEDGVKPRKIMITWEEWNARYGDNNV
jgi:S-DNA-T family DNA segregation ATPase FtsK/SpoIIIE